MSLQAVAQKGRIAGTVVDENNETLVGAVIEVYAHNSRIATTTSNAYGKYDVSVVAGKHTVTARYSGLPTAKYTGVIVQAGKTSTLNISFQPSTLNEIVHYEKPLVGREIGAENIRNAPTRDIKTIVATSDGIRRSDINAAGGRGGSTITVLDGMYIQPQYYNPSNEEYKKVAENDFMNVKANPLSTMSIDVDRASYTNVRRYINYGQRPPEDAVRVEEMINYFSYNYPAPTGDDPIAVHTELTGCPWQKDHKLLRIGMQAKKISYDRLPASNLVFLVDVSGSMSSPDKLPLLISSMKLLVNNLRNEDRVSIVTYAGSAGVVLESTPGSKKEKINAALERLTSGGSTAGAEGILTAYKVARENFIKGGNNRIIIATDGDFNVGVSSDNELEKLITKEREHGVFLSCLGFGTGNYKDAKMEMLADKGNGNYAYIDNLEEGRKTLVSEFGGTLFTIAKDVKAQIEFNPGKVASYRLIGYENRMLNAEDFKDDKKDAGELGAGHTVTFIYEIVPAGIRSSDTRKVDELKYQDREPARDDFSDELATIKFRYKKPDGDRSKEMVHAIKDKTLTLEQASPDTRFAYSVALFGMILKNSTFKGSGTLEDVIRLAKDSKAEDDEGYRAEFIKMVRNVNDNKLVSNN